MIFDFKTYQAERLGANDLTHDAVMDVLNAACIRLNAKRAEPLAVNMTVAKHIQACVDILRRIFPNRKIQYALDEAHGFHVTLRLHALAFTLEQSRSSDFRRMSEISDGVSTYATGELGHAYILVGFDFTLYPRKVRVF